VQAKSRQDRMGDFPASDVARHLRDLHQRRTEHPYAATTVLAIDGDIKEEPLRAAEVAVGDLPCTHPLVVACERVVASNGLASGCFDDIVIRFITSVQARDQAAEIVARVRCGGAGGLVAGHPFAAGGGHGVLRPRPGGVNPPRRSRHGRGSDLKHIRGTIGDGAEHRLLGVECMRGERCQTCSRVSRRRLPKRSK
jgi:hypothetical protein